MPHPRFPDGCIKFPEHPDARGGGDGFGAVPASVRSAEIWSEPLTETERGIIEHVLRDGTRDDLGRWLRHLLKVYDAREASRA